MKPLLSIIITSYKNPALLELCINSLRKSVENIDYEIVVADSSTEQETIDMMNDKFPEIKFFSNTWNTGYGYLVNQGLAAAQGDYVFIINGDIIIKDKKTITELMNFVKDNPDVGMAGPKQINFDNSVQPSCFRFYSPLTVLYRRTFLKKFSFAKKHLDKFLMGENTSQYDKAVDTDWLMGSALMVRRQAIDKVGKLDDQRYFMYFDDVDWCWRFWEAGYRVVYYPLASVFHYHGKASAGQNAFLAVLFNKYARIHIKSYLKFLLKFRGRKNPHELYNVNHLSK